MASGARSLRSRLRGWFAGRRRTRALGVGTPGWERWIDGRDFSKGRQVLLHMRWYGPRYGANDFVQEQDRARPSRDLVLNEIPSGRRRIAESITEETEALMRNVLLPFNENTMGPLEDTADRHSPLPFVFCLGNHSSGKSTFINFVLGRRVQETGVAPTDDGFTVIAPGNRDVNQDGPSLVGDPDMGFSGLRMYGPALIHHVNLKIRKDLAVDDIMLVDSPGMIDSPTDSISYVGAGQGRRDRGYDFEGVTKWLAERADVILLFFDPDKPGTTGETLSVLTNSLAGMDHKLHILLNKVDQFERIHDFARAYGSLCWNLSKVIPRKDLPRIYTMCTPLGEEERRVGGMAGSKDMQGWSSALADLETTRQEVIEQVKSAPERRIDNMITQLYDSARILEMHGNVLEHIRLDYQQLRRRHVLLSSGVALAGNAISLGVLYLMPTIWGFSATLSVSSLAGAAGVFLYGNHVLSQKCAEMNTESYLDGVFNRLYMQEVIQGDEFVKSIWLRVKSNMYRTLNTAGIPNLRRVRSSDQNSVKRVLQVHVPQLRRRAAPMNERL